jgi:glycosyltransferase involved in cell wall biosynthesis
LRILVVSQYFWPENFRVNEIVKFLKDKNYEVDVLTGYPNYPEGKLLKEYKIDPIKYSNFYGAKIYRVPIYLRRTSNEFQLFLNYISYMLSAIFIGYFYLRKKRYDAVFSFATSPITSAAPALFFSKIKSCKSFIWVLDLWPDIIKELNIIKNRFIYLLFSNYINYIYKSFDFILLQSNAFLDKFKKYNIKSSLSYFPAWAEFDSEKQFNEESITQFNPSDGVLNIVFTGNIGEVQNFDNVVKAAIILKNANIRWIIIGSGRYQHQLIKICEENGIKNIFFLGQKDPSLIKFYHSLADILFVTLKSGKAISSTIPGKFQTYLSCNKYILGFINGETKDIIEKIKIGSVVNPDDYKSLAKEILRLENNRSLLKIKNNIGTSYLKENYNKDKLLNNLVDKFNTVYQSYEKIKLIKKLNNYFYKSNFILSGLNLAYLGFLGVNQLKLKNDIYHWPDGIFSKILFREENIKKISGRSLLLNLEIPDFINRIYVLGNLSNVSKNFLVKQFKRTIIHIQLPYGSLEEIYASCPKNLTEEDLIICTLPTPKQEHLAESISKKEKYYKILCVGGAVSMASGEDTPAPQFIDNLGLEFLWRLKSETLRRIKRLFITSIYFLYGKLIKRYNSIRVEIIE